MEVTKQETWLIERARRFNRATRFRRFMGRIIPPVVIAIIAMGVYFLTRYNNPQPVVDILIIEILTFIILFFCFIWTNEELTMRLIEKQHEQIKKLEYGK